MQSLAGCRPGSHPWAKSAILGGLLQRAGFALPVADGTPLTASYANAFHLMHDLRKMGENNALTDAASSTQHRAMC